MLISILDDFAEKTELNLSYTFCEDRTQAREYLTTGSYDMLIGAPLTSGTCAELGFINSAPVIQSVLAYVQNPTSSGSGTIAVMSGIEELINTESYDNTLIFDNANECIQAVESKKADIAAGDRSVMEYYIYDNGSTLVTSLIPGQAQNVSITVSRECDAALLTVLGHDLGLVAQVEPDSARRCSEQEHEQNAYHGYEDYQ